MATFKRKFQSAQVPKFSCGIILVNPNPATAWLRPIKSQAALCVCCGSAHHGVWTCTAFLQKSYEDRWQLAKDKRLCFRCLAGDHKGKYCMKSQTCQIDGCRGNHHRILHESVPVVDQPVESVQQCTGGGSQFYIITRGRGQSCLTSYDNSQPKTLK